MRRYLPWLFLAAAVFALIATLTAKHVNVWYVCARMVRVAISISYILPHHSFR